MTYQNTASLQCDLDSRSHTASPCSLVGLWLVAYKEQLKCSELTLLTVCLLFLSYSGQSTPSLPAFPEWLECWGFDRGSWNWYRGLLCRTVAVPPQTNPPGDEHGELFISTQENTTIIIYVYASGLKITQRMGRPCNILPVLLCPSHPSWL